MCKGCGVRKGCGASGDGHQVRTTRANTRLAQKGYNKNCWCKTSHLGVWTPVCTHTHTDFPTKLLSPCQSMHCPAPPFLSGASPQAPHQKAPSWGDSAISSMVAPHLPIVSCPVSLPPSLEGFTLQILAVSAILNRTFSPWGGAGGAALRRRR